MTKGLIILLLVLHASFVFSQQRLVAERVFPAHYGVVSSVEASEDGALLVFAIDTFVYTVDGESGEVIDAIAAHPDKITHLALSKNNRLVATAPDTPGSPRTHVWSTEGLDEKYHLWGSGSLEFSPDSERLLVNDYPIVIYDMQDGSESARIAIKAESAVFGAEGKSVITARIPEADRWGIVIEVWDSFTGQKLDTVVEIKAEGEEWLHTEALAVSADGERLALADSTNSLTLWSLAEKRMLLEFEEEEKRRKTALMFGANDELLFTNAYDDVLVWDVREGELLREYKSDIFASGANFEIVDGGQELLFAEGHILGLWDVYSGEKQRHYSQPAAAVRYLHLASDVLYSKGTDDKLRIRDFATLEEKMSLDYKPSQRSGVFDIHAETKQVASQFSYDSDKLAVVSVPDGEVYSLYADEGAFTNVAFNSDASLLATGNNRGDIELFDTSSKESIAIWKAFDDNDSSTEFSFLDFNESDDLISINREHGASCEQSIRIWDTSIRELTQEHVLSPACFQIFSISDDGERLALSGYAPDKDGSGSHNIFELINLVTGETLISYENEDNNRGGRKITASAISPDKQFLAVAREPEYHRAAYVELIDLSTKEVVAVTEELAYQVYSMEFDASGNLLVGSGTQNMLGSISYFTMDLLTDGEEYLEKIDLYLAENKLPLRHAIKARDEILSGQIGGLLKDFLRDEIPLSEFVEQY